MNIQVRSGLAGRVGIGFRGLGNTFGPNLVPGSLTTGQGSANPAINAVSTVAIAKQAKAQSTSAKVRPSVGPGGQQTSIDKAARAVKAALDSQGASVGGGAITQGYGETKTSVSNASTATMQNSPNPTGFATSDSVQGVTQGAYVSLPQEAPRLPTTTKSSANTTLTPSDNIQSNANPGAWVPVKEKTFVQKYGIWLGIAAALGLTVYFVRR